MQSTPSCHYTEKLRKEKGLGWQKCGQGPTSKALSQLLLCFHVKWNWIECFCIFIQQEPRKKGKGGKGKRRGQKEVEGRKEPVLRRWKRRRDQLKRSSPSGTRKSSSCRSGSHVKKIPECWIVRGMRPEKWPMYLLLDIDFYNVEEIRRSGGNGNALEKSCYNGEQWNSNWMGMWSQENMLSMWET